MIPLNKPYLFDGYTDRLEEYLETYRFNHEEIVVEAEKKICEYTGAKHCIIVSNATSAIFMCLYIIKDGIRKDVLLSSYGYPAAYKACMVLGLNPVMVDMEMETLGMDPDHIERIINHNTLAVVNVETNGMMGDIDRIKTVCEKNGVYFLEDSASSITQKYNGKTSGTYGHMGVYSFTPTKVLNTGEGGAIVTNNVTLAKLLREFRCDPDVSRLWPPSLNFCMSPFLAAILIPQFDGIDYLTKQRERVHNSYKEYGLNIFENPKVTNSYPYAIYKTPSAKKLKMKLDRFKIGNAYQRYAIGNQFAGAVEMDTEIIYLPKLYDMTEDQIKSICIIAKGF